MAKKNIDVAIDLMAMLDSQVKLFEGDYTAQDLFHMDIPLKRSLVHARLSNVEMSNRRLAERNEVDAFSKGQVEQSTGAANLLGKLGDRG